jgi:hypothetical protein
MRPDRLVLATTLLFVMTACGSHAVSDQSRAASAAQATCQSRFDLKFHVQPDSKAGSEGFVRDLGHGRLRVTGSVPVRAGETHAGSYTCVVVPTSSGLRIVRFDATRAT